LAYSPLAIGFDFTNAALNEAGIRKRVRKKQRIAGINLNPGQKKIKIARS
jgi:hypothetical protein